MTGGGRGIGRGIAECLAEAGADVALAARNEAELESVAEGIRSLGRRAAVLPTDVTRPGALAALAEGARDALGAPTIWVNNAGGLPDATPRYLTRTPSDRWDAQIDLNLTAVFQGCTTAARVMDEGVIINISSTAARGGSLKNGPYAASKAAVNSLTQTMSVEFAPKIRVNAVGPGPVPTENFNDSTNFPPDTNVADMIRIPLKRLGTPEDIGYAVVFLAAPAARNTTA